MSTKLEQCDWEEIYTSFWKCKEYIKIIENEFIPHLINTMAYMSTQREVFEGQKMARRAKLGGLWKGGPGVLPRKFSKTCIANGAI